MVGIETKIIAALIGVLALVAMTLGYGHYQYGNGVKATKLVYEAALDKQKEQAAQQYAQALVDVAAATKELNDFRNAQELKDESNQLVNNNLAARLRRASGDADRLRDPNQPGCGIGSGSAPDTAPATPTDRADNAAQTGGLLSVQLSELLRQRFFEADEINAAYMSCYDTVMSGAK